MPKVKTTTKTKTKKNRQVIAKKITKKTKAKKITKKTPLKKEKELDKEQKYFEAVGRRKTSIARVRLFTQGKKEILINNKPYKVYFPILSLQKDIEAPFEKLNCLDKFSTSIRVKGGGIFSQAGACRHGLSRALVLLNPYFRKRLKKAGFLTRDSRMRERKKFGLKRARRAPQWSKR